MSVQLTRRQVARRYRRGDPRLFEQSSWWRPAQGRTLRLEEMTPAHREALMAWMLNDVEFFFNEWTPHRIRRCPLYKRLKVMS